MSSSPPLPDTSHADAKGPAAPASFPRWLPPLFFALLSVLFLWRSFFTGDVFLPAGLLGHVAPYKSGASGGRGSALEPAAMGRGGAVLSVAAFRGAIPAKRNSAAVEPLSILWNALRRQQPVGGLLSAKFTFRPASDRAGLRRQRRLSSYAVRLVYLLVAAPTPMLRMGRAARRNRFRLLRVANPMAATPHFSCYLLLDSADFFPYP